MSLWEDLIPLQNHHGRWQTSAAAHLGARSRPDATGAIYWTPADASAPPVRLFEGDQASPRLGKPEPVAPAPTPQVDPSFSPDGQWLAYSAFESGTSEIYVRSYSGRGGRWQISNGGGESAVWVRRGQELFYSAPEGIMAVPYTVSGGQFVPGRARLWTKQRPTSASAFAWDVAPDGKQIILMPGRDASPDNASGRQLTFVFHFLDEVRRRPGRLASVEDRRLQADLIAQLRAQLLVQRMPQAVATCAQPSSHSEPWSAGPHAAMLLAPATRNATAFVDSTGIVSCGIPGNCREQEVVVQRELETAVF
ncbi:MAG: hypothetical protein SGI92_17435 [Bryobacteraceae bacterium]|nr:hypothetical protein [Bryobacteraceae bacterium]